jgi:hypothetical protein
MMRRVPVQWPRASEDALGASTGLGLEHSFGSGGVDRRKDLAKLRGVENQRRVRPRHLRPGKRLSNSTVVVAEYDASGRLIRETHYTPDRAWVTKIVEAESDDSHHPAAS